MAPARCDRLAEVAWILGKPALRRPRHHLDGIDRGGQFRGGPDRVAGVVLQRVDERRERRSFEVAERAQRRDTHFLVARRVHHGPRQPVDRDVPARAAEKDARRRRGGAGDRRIRGVERVEHAVERARIGNGFERAERGSTRTGRRVGVEQQEQAVDGARAEERQPGDRRLARGRAVGAEIVDERFDLAR